MALRIIDSPGGTLPQEDEVCAVIVRRIRSRPGTTPVSRFRTTRAMQEWEALLLVMAHQPMEAGRPDGARFSLAITVQKRRVLSHCEGCGKEHL